MSSGACGTSSGASGEVAHRLPPSLGLPRASITSNGHRLPPSLGSNGASGEVAHRLPDSPGPGNHPIGVRPTRRPRRGRARSAGKSSKEEMKKRRRRDLSALHRRSYGNSDKERPKIGIARSAAIAYRATAAGAFDVAPRTHPSRSNAWKAERDRRAHVEAERDRQAHVTSLAGTASNRAATAKSSKEEMKKRRHQREAATAAQKPGAATAHLTFANECPKHIALLEGEEAAEAMLSRPTRLPNLIFAEPARSSALIPRRLDARGGQCHRPREVGEGAQAPGLEEQAAGTETPATPAAATASTLGAASQRGSATSPSTGLAPRRNSTSFNATMRESSTGCCPTTSLFYLGAHGGQW